MLPLRRVNQKPKNPAERIDTWAGPKLEEFFGGAPAPKPAVEEKPAIVEKVQKAPPKPSQIIPQPNNYRQVFDDLYAKGYGVNGAEYAQQDTPEKAAAWAWQTWGDGDLIAVQMPNNKWVGFWLIGDLKSLREFKAGDYVGFAGSWYNHNVYRLTSPAGPGKWNVENIEHMPKHTPVSVLEEKDMVKFPDYETPEQEEAKHLERTRVWQKEYGLKPEELRKLLEEYRAKHVPEEYLKKVEASYGHEDHVKDIIGLGWIIRGGKRVEVKGLADWPDFEMENGERLNVNFIEGRNRESEVYSLGFGMKGPMREEKEVKAEIVDHDDPERGLKAHYTAILPTSGTLLRVTPPGQPTVDQLVHVGDDIQEDDEFPAGSIHAKHLVVAVHKHQEYGLPVYSIVEAKVGDRPKGAGGKWRETQLGYINELVAQDGRILGFMQDSNEEIKVVGHEDLSMPGTLAEAEVEEENEEPEEE